MKRKTNIPVTVILCAILSICLICSLAWAVKLQRSLIVAKTTLFPGDEPYTPTKLEWAALTLQKSYGEASDGIDRPLISFDSGSDGRTIICTLLYLGEDSTNVLKATRDRIQKNFDFYAGVMQWKWLNLKIEENH